MSGTWTGEYYSNRNFTGTLAVRDDGSVLNFSTADPSNPYYNDIYWTRFGPGINIRWTGQIIAEYTEVYTFTCVVDNGASIWIDGVLKASFGSGTGSFSMSLNEGEIYDVKIEYQNDPWYDSRESNPGFFKFYWQSASLAQSLVSAYDGHTVPKSFRDYLKNSPLHLSVCCLIERLDGAVFGFTNAQKNLTIDGIIYRAGSGMTPSALEHAPALEVDNAEIEWILIDEQISERDVRAGLFDGAYARFFIVNRLNPEIGQIHGPKGNLGEITIKENGTCSIEFRSLIQKTDNDVLEDTSESCRAIRLGDERCKFDLDGDTEEGYPARANAWVTSVESGRKFTSNLSNTAPTNLTQSSYYVWQTVTFDNNVGTSDLSYHVAPVFEFDGNRFRLLLNGNIKKKLKVGWEGTAQAVRISDGAHLNFPFVITSVRRESDDSWSFQVKSTFWPTIPANEGIGFPQDYFRNGVLKWLTGNNAGIEMDVMSHANQVFTLQESMPSPIEEKDSFVVEVGCDRSCTMCRVRFGNVINFVGEPFIKPYEQILQMEK